MNDQELRGTVLFAGGGTGGHLFPGIAIAEQLADMAPGVASRFLCSTRPGDSQMLAQEQVAGSAISFTPVPAQPFGLWPRTLARFLMSWGASVRCVRDEIGQATRGGPVVVVAMGGFVAAPAARAAGNVKCQVVMVNLDASPGRANRWIAGRASRVLTAAVVSGYDWEVVRPIVRRAAMAPGDAQMCRKQLGLEPDRPTLFITGASLGARSINEFAAAFVKSPLGGVALRDGGWQVLHQTGKGEGAKYAEIYKEARIPARVVSFSRDMGCAWGAADCAVSRAGAGSVAEAWSNQVPTMFMPYPYHADQHQRLNALPLANAGAAVLTQDRVDPGDNLREAGALLLLLLNDAAKRGAMRQALTALGPADGAPRIARVLCEALKAG